MSGNGFKPGGNVAPSYRREIDDLKREIRQLKLMIANLEGPDHQPLEKQFSWPGNNSGYQASGMWAAPCPLTIVSFTACCYSYNPWFVDVSADNAVVYTVNIPMEQDSKTDLVRIPVTAGTKISIEVDGISGSDMTFAIGYKRGFPDWSRGA